MGWWVTIPGMLGEVFVPKSKSVVHFILVDFGKVGLLFDIKKRIETNLGPRKLLLVTKKLWTQNSFIQKEIWFNKILIFEIF